MIKKKGAKGAELLYGGKRIAVMAPKVKLVVDPTGAGDVLAGVFLTLVSRGAEPKRALPEAVKTASKSIHAFGVEHL